MTRMGVALALIAASAFPGAANALTLVRDGKAASVFVTADEPADSARLAVSVLQDYMKKATGADVPAVTESKLAADDPRVRILVGETKRAAALGVDVKKFEREQILIKTFGNELVIVGNDLRPDGVELMGTLWAADQFAEECLGVRHLWPGPLGEIVPKRATIEVAAMDMTYTPPLWQRKIRNIGLNERVQRILDKLGWSAQEFDKKQKQSELWWRFHRIGGSFKGTYGHAFGDYWERFHKDHPDWFALQPDGTRDNSRAEGGKRCRLCKSNRGLIEQVAKDAIEKMKREPQADTVSISPNDGGKATFCLCPNCKAWDAKDGEMIEIPGRKGLVQHVSLTDRFVKFYSAVAEIVAKEYPNRFLGAYAYSAYRLPPVHVKLPPNVMIGYVGFGYLNEERRQKARQEWLKWSQAANKLFLRPNLLDGANGLPTVYAHRLAEDLRFCAEHGMLVTDFDNCLQHWASDGLNYYVLARLLWNPKLDADAIIEDYCRAGFGKGAPAMKAYFAALEEMTDALAKSSEFEGRKKTTMGVLVKWYSNEFLAKLQGHLDGAKRASAGDADALARIAFIETAVRYAPLRRDWALAVEADRANSTKESKAKVKETLARKEAFYQQLGITWTLNVPYLKFNGF